MQDLSGRWSVSIIRSSVTLFFYLNYLTHMTLGVLIEGIMWVSNSLMQFVFGDVSVKDFNTQCHKLRLNLHEWVTEMCLLPA